MAKIILECCQNHNGDREILKKMIHAAAESGAHYCKMQSIRSEDLANRERFEAGREENGISTVIKRPFGLEKERLSKLDLSLDDHQWFIEECTKAGIAPMTTVFNHAMVKPVSQFNWDAIKVASYDCPNIPFLEHLSQYFNTLIVSTGASRDDEIIEASKVLKNKDATFLHCVSIYPTSLDILHLARMLWIKEVTGNCGLSDHTLVSRDGIQADKAALALGANVIERHFTILEADQSKDGPVSIKPDLATELVQDSQKDPKELEDELNHNWPDWKKTTMGNAHYDLSDVENLNRDYYRGRFTSHIPNGQIDNWEPWDSKWDSL